MCGPMAGIGMGLQIMGQVASFAGQQQQVNDYNAAAAQNAVNAGIAASHSYAGAGRKFGSDAIAINQEAQKAVFEARKAQGQAVASAGSSGYDFGSISVASVLSDINSQEARSEFNADLKREDRKWGLKEENLQTEASAKNRINSMPFKRGPSPLALAVNIGNSVFGAFQQNQNQQVGLV